MSAIMMVHNYNNRAPAAAIGGLVLNLDMTNSSSWSGSGTTINDLTGNGYNGTLVGSPTTTSTSFTSSTTGPAYVATNYNLPASNFTVRIIMNMNASFFWATHWGNDSWSATKGFLAYSASSTSIAFGSGGLGNQVTYSTTHQGTKRQYDYTYDGTNWKIYINGSLGNSGTYSTPIQVSTNNLYFGARHQNGGSGATDGNAATYYLMQVYNTALSASQISTAYNNNKTPYGI